MKREWLVKIRREKGFTQESLAAAAGVKRTTYNRYETGARTPDPLTASKIADVLEFDCGYFFWPERAETAHNPDSAA